MPGNTQVCVYIYSKSVLVIPVVSWQPRSTPLSFVHPFSRNVLSTCCGPEAVPGTRGMRVNETCFSRAQRLAGRTEVTEVILMSPHTRPPADQTPADTLMTSAALEARCVLPCHRLTARAALSLADGLPAGAQQSGNVTTSLFSRAPCFCSDSHRFFTTTEHVLCSPVGFEKLPSVITCVACSGAAGRAVAGPREVRLPQSRWGTTLSGLFRAGGVSQTAVFSSVPGGAAQHHLQPGLRE